jgi:cytoskeletal protein CcmA (bactofilin family)
MVFRRDNKSGDAFQRQMSALRQQLGNEGEAEAPGAEQTSPAGYSGYNEPANSGSFSSALNSALARASSFNEGDIPQAPVQYEAPITGDIEPEDPALPEIPAVDAQTTVIAQDATWKGEITTDGTIHVYGRFEGSIKARQDVFIAADSQVDATINAGTVLVAGNLKGTIRGESRFEVLPTGRVNGDVLSPTLVVHEGAVIAGQIRMGGAEAPAANEPQAAPAASVIQRRPARGTA